MVQPTLALSTSWCSYRHTDGYTMLREMADLGFSHVELSHGIRITLVPGILRAVEEGVVKVSSTHNFCPLPTGIMQAAPNLFEPSAREAREHEQWLRHTKRSLDFSAQVKARVMVLHLGSVEFFWFNPARTLKHYLRSHPHVELSEDRKYQRLLPKCVERLRKRMAPYWAQVKASIEEIRTYATEKGVALGFENREKFDELPLDDDFPALFESLTAPHTAGYWHDTGHAALKEGMGLLKHREHLEKNARRLIGFHLHDVNLERDDHQAIGSGQIDFEMISTFWQAHHVLVLELSPRLMTADVVASKARIEELLAARFGA